MRTKTYLALDYGKLRIGLAVGNDLLGTAQPLPPIMTVLLQRPNGQIILDTITPLIKTWCVNHLVFGAPLNALGEATTMSKKINCFGNALGKALDLPVSYADERLSSAEAHRILRAQLAPGKKLKKKNLALRDSIAAQLILEAYLAHN